MSGRAAATDFQRSPTRMSGSRNGAVAPTWPAYVVPPPVAPIRELGGRRLLLLLACGGVLAVASALQLDADGRVRLTAASPRPLPALCTLRRMTGVPCPGCGLTRCFVAMAHGDLKAAWRYNSVGIGLFLLVVIQLPYQAGQLLRIACRRPCWQFEPLGAPAALAIVVGLLLQWLLNLARFACPSFLILA